MMSRADDFDWWQKSLRGEKPPIHDSDPQCGYFKVRDRRGLNKDLAPIKRPFVAAAIWKDGDEFKAEVAGTPVNIDHAWPYVAKYPIPYETYQFWHSNEKWPEEAA